MLRDIAVGPKHLIDRTHREHLRSDPCPYTEDPVVEVEGTDFGLDGSHRPQTRVFATFRFFQSPGAFANLLLRDVPAAGVVAASGGNHGAAVAFAAMKLKKPARIFVPEVASPTKLERIRECGADLVVTGRTLCGCAGRERGLGGTSGALVVHAYDQVETLLGQATVGLEFEEQCPQLDTLIVAVGGGGLIGGIAPGIRRESRSSGWSRKPRPLSPGHWRRAGRLTPKREESPPTRWLQSG